MQSSDRVSQQIAGIGYPATWDVETLKRKWMEFLKVLMEDGEVTIPQKRVQFQVEQSSTYQDILRRWPRMSESERLDTWKRLMELSEKCSRELLPACTQCGECCRKGSPTLQVEDLELLRQGKIPWNMLYTLRRGEAVRSPFEEKLFFLLDERIKIREKDGNRECAFLDGANDVCAIYADRPVQCRAQACWDPEPAKEVAGQPYLTRRDIFQDVELLMDLMAEHDKRCAFGKLKAAFEALEETKGENVEEVLELLAYEDHFRHFLGEQLKIPEDTLELVFGRSFADLVSVFGFKVRREPDSTRCLVPDRG
jgi:Fe-S-cluster containining protein